MSLSPELVRACFVRDGWRCRHCRGSNIHPHHLIYKSQQGPDELWNLLTLCANCHDGHHRGFLLIKFGESGGNAAVKFVRLKGWTP